MRQNAVASKSNGNLRSFVMDSVELLRTFQEVVSQGSFSKASRRLGISKATVSKYVAELETRLGVRLLNRSTRALSATDAGTILHQRSTPFLDMFEEAQLAVQAHASNPTGLLHIALPPGTGHGALSGLLSKFMLIHPEVQLDLRFQTRLDDMAGEGIDLALQFGPLEDENLIVRHLARRELALCASPDYWRWNGLPTHPSELIDHQALKISLYPIWKFQVDGEVLEVPVKSRAEASEAGPLIQMAVHGLGVLYLPELQVRAQLESGELVRALAPFAPKDMWVSMAYLQRRHNSAALRALIGFLEDNLKEGSSSRAG
jgi:DNA-binding transcriptional LysR family regulator